MYRQVKNNKYPPLYLDTFILHIYLDEVEDALARPPVVLDIKVGKCQVDSVAQWRHDSQRAVAIVGVRIGEIGTLDHAAQPPHLQVAHCQNIVYIKSQYKVALPAVEYRIRSSMYRI